MAVELCAQRWLKTTSMPRSGRFSGRKDQLGDALRVFFVGEVANALGALQAGARTTVTSCDLYCFNRSLS
jgi:hypothetical protein